MTKIVYASPDISPDVWTPPRDVIVLPISEHPAFDNQTEKLPSETRRRRKHTKETQATMMFNYLQEHQPATVHTIADALGMNWERVKWVALANPDVFQPVGRVQVRKVYRTLWGLVEK